MHKCRSLKIKRAPRKFINVGKERKNNASGDKGGHIKAAAAPDVDGLKMQELFT